MTVGASAGILLFRWPEGAPSRRSRMAWCEQKDGRRRAHPAQAAFIERLEALLRS